MNTLTCRLGMACTLLAAWSAASQDAAAAGRPNVILIMADDLGYEGLAVNGGTSYTTPRLDRLAADGMLFTHCYSQPVCTPSRNKIMTGRSNARNYRAFGVLTPEEITFGNVMQAAGYKTCIAGKWQLTGGAPVSATHGWGTTPAACGFDESCMWAYAHNLAADDAKRFRETFAGPRRQSTSRFWNPAILENGEYRPTTLDDYGPDIFSQFILDYLERRRDDEFFVYYPMVLTHGPFIATPDSDDLSDEIKFESQSKYFEDMIQYTGVLVERILQKLHELGIAENTLVLFTADNGTGRSLVSMMGDRIIPGGKALPVDAGCHVPMIAYWPGTIAPGSTCHDLIEFSDFFPTVAQLGGARLPTDRVIDGRSFLAQLKGQAGYPRDAVVVHYDRDPNKPSAKFRRVRFAYDGRYKLYLDGRLYDVPHDWEEEHPMDMAAGGADARLATARLKRVLGSMPPWQPDNSAHGLGADAETTRRLEKLYQLRAARK